MTLSTCAFRASLDWPTATWQVSEEDDATDAAIYCRITGSDDAIFFILGLRALPAADHLVGSSSRNDSSLIPNRSDRNYHDDDLASPRPMVVACLQERTSLFRGHGCAKDRRGETNQ